MASLEEIRTERLKKLEALKEKGINPYPAKSNRKESVGRFLGRFEKLLGSGEETILAGRLISKRSFGGLIFANLDDGHGVIQLYLKKDEMEEELFNLFSDNIDVGDFIESTGTAYKTKKGEKSFLVKKWTILSKSLRSLPEKWHGLQDPEARHRQRYLDLLLNPELRKMFELKEKFWGTTRKFLKDEGFLEVETPTLEITTGGAEAKPFKTHHDDFDIDVFLRISVGELWQKRLMAAGFEKTFEIGRVYRNEGSSSEHLQEFTNMEFYLAYADYKDGMKLARKMYQEIARKVFGRTKFETRGHSFDLDGDWPVIHYVEEIEDKTGINVLEAPKADLEAKLEELGVVYDGENRERLIDSLWKHIRKSISGPAFLVNHPKLVSPLAKEDPLRPETVERFQIIIAGSEVGNGYSELNNPIEQKTRFDLQNELLKKGDSLAMVPDHEFVEMLEYAMPPTCGFGFGERLFAFMVDKPIRETQMFPLMKPRD
ncbi:lysine--tRNA ligase [Candidatus Campbellbacteria bacterium CG11_big_fil_rev_8_21_14_0_20_44_21]|uniref:Lysine--tRNA ligase n=1 Tax=Candidatus Campbellbacteria bacterium CG22_combo_CG10-13_8_21_14_all_43_18 TaxID=1974530 RepID=A0A2H0DW31_9BACT|nr:MAG: lysine--tRNA ligase [Candidatus Campbellbacteria bacterium CG22_combo_CG10-13_8_21_14_all_43_18]PIR24128.1 MAG: lysine--tRNA ligase [Candidatus Campbellbacteria bacterium CG11_big_fil_rev_8_21_14_0_20_44_21]